MKKLAIKCSNSEEHSKLISILYNMGILKEYYYYDNLKHDNNCVFHCQFGHEWLIETEEQAKMTDKRIIEFKNLIFPKGNKMQVLSAVNKWKNEEFTVFCKDFTESEKFLRYVGFGTPIRGGECWYSYVSASCGMKSSFIKPKYEENIITFQEFKNLQKDDKIGILSCKKYRIISDEGNLIDSGANGIVTYEELKKEFKTTLKDWDGCSIDLNVLINRAYGYNRIELEEYNDDKKKILSDDLMPNKIIYNAIKNHDDDFASMSYSVSLNPYLSNHRLHENMRMFNFDNEIFKREYLGEWGYVDGVDWAKEYDSKWIGKGEDMKKQTLFNKLGVERVWINEEKRSVTVELWNGNIGTAKADKNDEFCEQTGFANAYVIAKSGMSKTEFKREFAEELDYLKNQELKEKKIKAIADLERKQRKEMQNLRKSLNNKK